MTTRTRSLKGLCQLTLQALFVPVLALGVPRNAGAADVTVDCDGPGPADFGSISEALIALSLEGPNTIFVLPGNCVENVVIDNRERLTIDAPDGQVVIDAADPDQHVIVIRNSRGIVLRALAANNSDRRGIVVTSSTGVRLDGIHATANGGGGYEAEDRSEVTFSSHATGNGGEGLLVARDSLALIVSATLTGNGRAGILCRDGSTCLLDGNVVIENNGGGLGAVNSTLIRMNSNNGPNSIQGNAAGISLIGNSRAVLTGPNGNFVTGNTGPGIQLDTNSSVALINTTVSNNTGPGVRVLRHSVAGILDGFGSNSIGNNGGANLVCDDTSLLHGNLSGITAIECQHVERAVGPPRPGITN